MAQNLPSLRWTAVVMSLHILHYARRKAIRNAGARRMNSSKICLETNKDSSSLNSFVIKIVLSRRCRSFLHMTQTGPSGICGKQIACVIITAIRKNQVTVNLVDSFIPFNFNRLSPLLLRHHLQVFFKEETSCKSIRSLRFFH